MDLDKKKKKSFVLDGVWENMNVCASYSFLLQI